MIPRTFEEFKEWLADCVNRADSPRAHEHQGEWPEVACLQRDVIELLGDTHFMVDLNIKLIGIGIDPVDLIDNYSIVPYGITEETQFLSLTPRDPYSFEQFMNLVQKHYFSKQAVA